MEFTVISAEREQLLPDKEQSWWAPCWRQEIPTAGAVGAWSRSGARRSRQPHMGHGRKLEQVGVAPPRKPAEGSGLLVTGAPRIYHERDCLYSLDLKLQRGSAGPEITEARKSADRTQTQVFLHSTVTDYESKDVICEKTFPFSTFVPGNGKEQSDNSKNF